MCIFILNLSIVGAKQAIKIMSYYYAYVQAFLFLINENSLLFIYFYTTKETSVMLFCQIIYRSISKPRNFSTINPVTPTITNEHVNVTHTGKYFI